MQLRAFLVIVGVAAFASQGRAADKVLRVSTPMPAPVWALLERQLLDSNAQACREFYRKYFDERGWLLCVERWGGDDGPDDAIENCNDWPILHALGASDEIRTMYAKAWEGRVLIQAGSYGEHEFTTVATESEKRMVNDRYLELLLEPGAGSRITLGTKRYTRQPSLSLPW